MNIPANALSCLGYASFASRMSGKGKKENTERQKAEMSQEERMISEFREQHDPAKEMEQQIYGKFCAGKALSLEELKFLARSNPKLYQEVKEIMQERAAMEQQMEQAETKQQVASVHANELTYLKDTMGTGAQAKSQAMKNMARANQMESAYVQFTATPEYREKEDEESQALEQREAQIQAELAEAERREQEAESMQAEETAQEDGPAAEGAIPEESAPEESGQPPKDLSFAAENRTEEVRAESAERELERLEEQRRSKGKGRRRRQGHPAETGGLEQEDYRQLQLKIRDLYRNTGQSSAPKGVDIHM